MFYDYILDARRASYFSVNLCFCSRLSGLNLDYCCHTMYKRVFLDDVVALFNMILSVI